MAHPYNKTEGNKMRTIRHYVINKTTGKAIYTDCDRNKCIAFISKCTDKDNYIIGYKWLSI